MREFMNATERESGNEVLVNPNDVVLNHAGTKMTVCTHSEKAFDRGDQRPNYQSYHSLKFLPKDAEIMDSIFMQELKKQKAKRKKQKTALRAKRQEQRA